MSPRRPARRACSRPISMGPGSGSPMRNVRSATMRTCLTRSAKAIRAIQAAFDKLSCQLAEGKAVEMGGLRLQVSERKPKRQYQDQPGWLKHQPPLAPRILRTKRRRFISQEVLLRFVEQDGITH